MLQLRQAENHAAEPVRGTETTQVECDELLHRAARAQHPQGRAAAWHQLDGGVGSERRGGGYGQCRGQAKRLDPRRAGQGEQL